MRTIKIDGVKYKVPTTWDDLTLEKFNGLRSLEDARTSGKITDGVEFMNQFVAVLTGIEGDTLLKLTEDELEKISNLLSEIVKKPISSFKEQCVVLDGVPYAFDLDSKLMTRGMFIDSENITRGVNIWDVAHKVTAMFLRPMSVKDYLLYRAKKMLKMKVTFKDFPVKKYDYSSMENRAEIFSKKLPMTAVYAVITFFLLLKKVSNVTSQSSIQNNENQEKMMVE
jgi:hypothetical protein